MSNLFGVRESVELVEEGDVLAPRFDSEGLIPAVVSATDSREILMLGYMNAEALSKTVRTGEAHYWSRSRKCLWRKGATSGMIHRVVEMRIDDDQDALWLRVRVEGIGGSCHVGYRSCFYRSVILGNDDGVLRLRFEEREKIFDPEKVYAGAENPTRL